MNRKPKLRCLSLEQSISLTMQAIRNRHNFYKHRNYFNQRVIAAKECAKTFCYLHVYAHYSFSKDSLRFGFNNGHIAKRTFISLQNALQYAKEQHRINPEKYKTYSTSMAPHFYMISPYPHKRKILLRLHNSNKNNKTKKQPPSQQIIAATSNATSTPRPEAPSIFRDGIIPVNFFSQPLIEAGILEPWA